MTVSSGYEPRTTRDAAENGSITHTTVPGTADRQHGEHDWCFEVKIEGGHFGDRATRSPTGDGSRLTTNGRRPREAGLLQDRVDVDLVPREHRRERRDDAGAIRDREANVVRAR